MFRIPLCLLLLSLWNCSSLSRTWKPVTTEKGRAPTERLPALPNEESLAPAESDGRLFTVPTGASNTQPAPNWEKRYQAVKHPILTLQVGSGPRRIMVISSLHGHEIDSVKILEAFADQFVAQPDLTNGVTVLLVRSPNPDGVQDRTLTNSHGVDLNRNFPSARFPTQGTTLTGHAPASEPETQGLLKLIAEFAPDRIVHIRSGSGQRGLVTVNRACEPHVLDHSRRELAETESGRPALPASRKSFETDLARFDEYKAGSLEEYADQERKADLMQIELPRHKVNETERVNPEPFLSIALATTGRVGPKVMMIGLESSTLEKTPAELLRDGSTNQEPESTADQDIVRPDGAKGFVQFLPPPVEFPGVGDENPKYFELPPPG